MTGPLLLFLHAVCPLLFFTDFTRNPYITQVLLLQSGLLCALIVESVAAVRRGSAAIRPTALDLPVAAWAVASLLGWALSWLAHPSLRTSIALEGFRGQFFLFVNILLPFAFAARTGEGWDTRCRRAALAAGAVAAAYGLLQYAGVEWVWDKSLNPYSGRPVSTFGNPNFLSSYLVMLLPLALWEFGEARSTARSGWGLIVLLYGGCLICTMTRSSWIGAAAAVALFLVLTRPRGARLRSILLLGGLLAAMGLLWPGSPVSDGGETPVRRVVELVRGVAGREVYGSWHQRLLIWSCAWDMFKERPLLGKGWGCFELFYPFYQGAHLLDPVFRGFRTHANNAHNVFLEILSQAGLVGAGIAAWAGALGAALFRRRLPGLQEPRRALAAAKGAALAGMIVDNIFGNVSLFFAVPGFLFAWIAGSLAADLSTEGKKDVSFRRFPAVAAALLACLAAAGGTIWCFRAWRAEVHFFEGYKRSQRGDLSGAERHLEASRVWRRREVNNAYELANVYLRQARQARENGFTEQARVLLEKAVLAYDDALAANAGYDEIHFNKASALLALGREPDAVRHLRLSTAINPIHADGYRLLGSLYARRPDPEAEREVWERALRAFPDDPGFKAALARREKIAPSTDGK